MLRCLLLLLLRLLLCLLLLLLLLLLLRMWLLMMMLLMCVLSIVCRRAGGSRRSRRFSCRVLRRRGREGKEVRTGRRDDGVLNAARGQRGVPRAAWHHRVQVRREVRHPG